MKHFLSFSLPISWGSQVVFGGQRFHHPSGPGMFASPGNEEYPGVRHVNEGTWGMSRELGVAVKGPQ